MKTVTQFLVLVILCTSLFSCTKELTDKQTSKVEQGVKYALDKKLINPISINIVLDRNYEDRAYSVNSSAINYLNGEYIENWNSSFENVFSPAVADTGTFLLGTAPNLITLFVMRDAHVQGEQVWQFSGTGKWYLKDATGVYKKLKRATGTLTYEEIAGGYEIEDETHTYETYNHIEYHLTGFSN